MGDGHAEVLVGIYRSVIDADFVVKMRPGGASALSDIANHVAAMHCLACRHRETGKMTIAGADAVAVIDHDCLAIAAQKIAKCDHPVGRGDNRGAIAAANINTAVERALAVRSEEH